VKVKKNRYFLVPLNLIKIYWSIENNNNNVINNNVIIENVNNVIKNLTVKIFKNI